MAATARKKSTRPVVSYDNVPNESALFGESIDKFANAAMQFAVTQATHNQRLNGIDATVKNLQEDTRTIRDVQQDQNQYINARISSTTT